MTPEELGEQVRDIIPGAVFDIVDGELVIYTKFYVEGDEVKEL